MKKILILFLCAVITGKADSQANADDLPPEFKNIAAQAFQKLKPETKQWFIDAAKQHPAGSFDTAWARRKLSQRFSFSELNDFGAIFTAMMEYQKMAMKEAREERKIASNNKQMVLTSKNNKIEMDNKKINQSKTESQEKADNAMSAAQTSLWLGIINGAITTTSGNLQQNNSKISNVRMTTTMIQKTDSSKQKEKNTDLLQKEVNKQQNQASQDDEAKKASEDHKKEMEDAIKKLLDQMARMKPDLIP